MVFNILDIIHYWGENMAEKPRRKETELLVKWLWDLLPAYPPYPPLPRGLLRGILGREFEERFMKFPSPFKE